MKWVGKQDEQGKQDKQVEQSKQVKQDEQDKQNKTRYICYQDEQHKQ